MWRGSQRGRFARFAAPASAEVSARTFCAALVARAVKTGERKNDYFARSEIKVRRILASGTRAGEAPATEITSLSAALTRTKSRTCRTAGSGLLAPISTGARVVARFSCSANAAVATD